MVARAVLDLGSNSFRALLAEELDGELLVREKLKDKVQLLRGFKDGKLHPDAIERGIESIQRFRQRLSSVERDNIRVCGTHALRQSSNSGEFVRTTEQLLGVPVQIISGEEEARLIYGGVLHHLPRDNSARMVLDVGGGSTEFAYGSGFAPRVLKSVGVGCVAFTDNYFSDQIVTEQSLERARADAIVELKAALASRVVDLPETVETAGVEIIGTSGTVESLIQTADANGWSSNKITAESLAELRAALCDQRWIPGIGLPGLTPERIDIFPAGVAIVSAIFDVLRPASIRYVEASMQEGMLYEQSQRRVEDVQWRTVRDLGRRFHVDQDQIARVRNTADRLWKCCKIPWFGNSEEYGRLLGWACELHEIGVQVSAQHYHRHGSYVIANGALRGFSRQEQAHLALLVRSHRRSLPALAFGQFEAVHGLRMMRLAALLRLAVILERSRDDDQSPEPLSARVDENMLFLELPQGWLRDHPLSRSELAQEQEQLRQAHIELHLEDLLL